MTTRPTLSETMRVGQTWGFWIIEGFTPSGRVIVRNGVVTKTVTKTHLSTGKFTLPVHLRSWVKANGWDVSTPDARKKLALYGAGITSFDPSPHRLPYVEGGEVRYWDGNTISLPSFGEGTPSELIQSTNRIGVSVSRTTLWRWRKHHTIECVDNLLLASSKRSGHGPNFITSNCICRP